MTYKAFLNDLSQTLSDPLVRQQWETSTKIEGEQLDRLLGGESVFLDSSWLITALQRFGSPIVKSEGGQWDEQEVARLYADIERQNYVDEKTSEGRKVVTIPSPSQLLADQDIEELSNQSGIALYHLQQMAKRLPTPSSEVEDSELATLLECIYGNSITFQNFGGWLRLVRKGT